MQGDKECIYCFIEKQWMSSPTTGTLCRILFYLSCGVSGSKGFCLLSGGIYVCTVAQLEQKHRGDGLIAPVAAKTFPERQ